MTINQDSINNLTTEVGFSFIVPIYNNATYLLDCIDSLVRSCTMQDKACELILVDDGSTDACARLIDYMSSVYATGNCSVMSIHQINKGASSARNKGVDIANGRYVVFIDSDDTIVSDKMAECMNIVTDKYNIDILIYGISFNYYNKDKCYRTYKLTPPQEGLISVEECLNNINILFDTNSLSSMCTKIVKRESLYSLYYNENMIEFEDLDFSLRLLGKCKNLYFYRYAVYNYRQSSNEKVRMLMIDNVNEIVNQIIQDLEELGCEKEYIEEQLKTHLISAKQSSMSYAELKKKYPKDANRILGRRILHRARRKASIMISSMLIGLQR